jgi:hypothetical protein
LFALCPIFVVFADSLTCSSPQLLMRVLSPQLYSILPELERWLLSPLYFLNPLWCPAQCGMCSRSSLSAYYRTGCLRVLTTHIWREAANTASSPNRTCPCSSRSYNPPFLKLQIAGDLAHQSPFPLTLFSQETKLQLSSFLPSSRLNQKQ